MKTEQFDVFSTPIFRIPLPEFRKYHDEVTDLFRGMVESGRLKPHQHGYGYQTPTNLFFPNAYGNRPYFVEVLGKKFCEACERILYAARTDTGTKAGSDFAWVNTLTVGWASIQTSETWDVEPPWHSHLPATLSGCYYVSTASRKGEGNLQFMSPLADTIFQPQTIEIEPREGHMIIFPSYLRHRPSRCPNTDRIRIALCMDSHWTVQLSHQLPPQLRRR